MSGDDGSAMTGARRIDPTATICLKTPAVELGERLLIS
jgi:hypothetical protein